MLKKVFESRFINPVMSALGNMPTKNTRTSFAHTIVIKQTRKSNSTDFHFTSTVKNNLPNRRTKTKSTAERTEGACLGSSNETLSFTGSSSIHENTFRKIPIKKTNQEYFRNTSIANAQARNKQAQPKHETMCPENYNKPT
jgi:hypothetical protein